MSGRSLGGQNYYLAEGSAKAQIEKKVACSSYAKNLVFFVLIFS